MSELERWESRFAAEHYVFGTEPNAFLRAQSALIAPGARVLSIADGEGRNGVWLAEQGFDVTAQDFSPRAQQKARALAVQRGVSLRFEMSDLTARVWEDAEYDAVVGIFFQFLGPQARADVFRGMARALRKGGLLLIEGYGLRQLEFGTGGPKVLENLYTEALLREAFADFTDVRTWSHETAIDEGPGHSGMSALVDLVARR